MQADLSIQWGDEARTIIHITYGKKWTWHDFRQIDHISWWMLSSVQHRVHFILDITDAVLPTNTVTHFPYLAKNVTGVSHPNAGRIMLVGESTTMLMLWSIFRRVYPAAAEKGTLCATLDEAYAALGCEVAEEQAAP